MSAEYLRNSIDLNQLTLRFAKKPTHRRVGSSLNRRVCPKDLVNAWIDAIVALNQFLRRFSDGEFFQIGL